MKKSTRSACSFSSIEILESRIAPALLAYGANLLGGAGNPTTGEQSVGEDSVTLVKVLSGQALVYYAEGRIYGISAGDGASIQVYGNIRGDVIGNLGPNGYLSDSDGDATNGRDGGLLLANDIKLQTFPLHIEDGDVGNIITGGSVFGFNINGQIKGIYAGDGVFHPQSDIGSTGSFTLTIGAGYPDLDLNPILVGHQSTFSFSSTPAQQALLAPSADITNGTITDTYELQIITGNGSPTGTSSPTVAGAAGGTASNITIKNASVDPGNNGLIPSYTIFTGNGGDGKTGGAGGSITNIIELASVGDVNLITGNGGIGLAGAGGAGGSIRSLDMGSQTTTYTLTAGNGGQGAPAGDGGSVTNNNFANISPTAGQIKAADMDGDGDEDLVILNMGTGEFVVEENIGGLFFPLIQHDTATIVDAFGSGASDLDVADVDGDGSFDVVVTYKGSNNISTYFNDGTGRFWDPLDLKYEAEESAYTLSGDITYTEFVGGSFVSAANTKSGSYIIFMPLETDPNNPPVIFETLTSPVTAMTSADGKTFLGLDSGQIMVGSGGNVTDSGETLAGAIISMDTGNFGSTMVAMSSGKEVGVYQISGTGLTLNANVTLTAGGKPQSIMMINDDDILTQDAVAVLMATNSSSRVDIFEPNASVPATSYTLSNTVSTTSIYRQFTDYLNLGGGIGIGAISSSLSEFGASTSYGAFATYVLPFSGKQIYINAGNGGFGVDIGTVLGKGGDGGSITGLNADTTIIILTAGDGGDSTRGGAGSGGSVSNPASFTVNAKTLAPQILSQDILTIQVGDAGSPTGAVSAKASGGNGGNISGMTLNLDNGQIILTAGDASDGNGGAGGKGGSITSIKAKSQAAGGLLITAGDGGDAPVVEPGMKASPAGAGGSISNFNYTRDLSEDSEGNESDDNFIFTAGHGGSSLGAAGGNGGGFSNITIVIDTPDSSDTEIVNSPDFTDAELDSTITLTFTAGNAGDGTIGGNGGGLTGMSYKTIHDQILSDGSYLLNYVVATVTGGNGGNGSAGNGGNGGTLSFQKSLAGITAFDPDAVLPLSNPEGIPFIAIAGNAGNGTLKGGIGGSVSSLKLPNAPTASGLPLTTTHVTGASLFAGSGGQGGTSDGGKGGDISGILLGVEGQRIIALAGDGGAGGTSGGITAKGGTGGGILSSTFGLVDFDGNIFDSGLLLSAGNGGSGVKTGGIGGALSGLTVNVSASTSGAPAILTAGDGGAASGAGGIGGKGGDVASVTNSKDVFGIISLIEAGNGGAALAGKGGAGGNVTNTKISGFIGRPTIGVFDPAGTIVGAYAGIPKTELANGLAQGLFVGRGGAGSSPAANGISGFIKTVSASAIGAVAAAVDAGGLFAAASSVTSLKTDFIGYDRDDDGVFNSTVGATSPGTAIPIDGFIMAVTTKDVTGTFLASFTS